MIHGTSCKPVGLKPDSEDPAVGQSQARKIQTFKKMEIYKRGFRQKENEEKTS